MPRVPWRLEMVDSKEETEKVKKTDPEIEREVEKKRDVSGTIRNIFVKCWSALMRVFSSKREAMTSALIGAIVGGFFTLGGVYIAAPLQIRSASHTKAERTKVAFREFVRTNLKQFFKDYKGIRDQLSTIEEGGIESFIMSEAVHPLNGVIREGLTCLKPKEMLTVSLAIGKEGIMVQRAKNLNMLMERVRSKKLGDSKASITSELQMIKHEFLAYLKRHVEMNVLRYQALESLDADEYVYKNGKKKSHKDVLAFWQNIQSEGKPPYSVDELLTYEPHGFWESEQ
jgi:hypothetical protein